MLARRPGIVFGATDGDCHHTARHKDPPGVCRRACIAGHRIRVQDIVVWHEKRGYSPDEIVDMFPGVTLATSTPL